MDENEIRQIVNTWFETTESGESLHRETVVLVALEVERKARYRAEDIAKKAMQDIGLLCSAD